MVIWHHQHLRIISARDVLNFQIFISYNVRIIIDYINFHITENVTMAP